MSSSSISVAERLQEVLVVIQLQQVVVDGDVDAAADLAPHLHLPQIGRREAVGRAAPPPGSRRRGRSKRPERHGFAALRRAQETSIHRPDLHRRVRLDQLSHRLRRIVSHSHYSFRPQSIIKVPGTRSKTQPRSLEHLTVRHFDPAALAMAVKPAAELRYRRPRALPDPSALAAVVKPVVTLRAAHSPSSDPAALAAVVKPAAELRYRRPAPLPTPPRLSRW